MLLIANCQMPIADLSNPASAKIGNWQSEIGNELGYELPIAKCQMPIFRTWQARKLAIGNRKSTMSKGMNCQLPNADLSNPASAKIGNWQSEIGNEQRS